MAVDDIDAAVLPAGRAARPVAVIGAGTLGRRIALVFATRGGAVRVHDPSAGRRTAAVRYVRETLPGVIAARNAADAAVAGAAAGEVRAVDDLAAAVEGAWLVVEAVPEELELKRRVFADLDRLSAPDAVLATNSSSFASRLLLGGVTRPARVLNTHFYMPPEQTVVELMTCGHTDRAVLDLMLAVLPEYGLHPFEARKESTGFIHNRIWAAIKREALSVVAEGVATPQEVDRLIQINGGGSGPFRAMDAIGLDVVLAIEEHYADENPDLPEGPRAVLRSYIERGRLGTKSGAGFYDDYGDYGDYGGEGGHVGADG
ncbi:3-hydroxyacyl-CoA dehydrogenase family protein [Streptomyces sp. NBC_01187]|uniref:3-hydroxyacyl-CoA dehydrogenase family protein n=1 Tax=Streptomyces sp. NBC_01187 TaxID=2903766 RepID=UPI0038673F97|nr:3-hydroxyacyl-CoA dehydrogenase NAD-binding domain-containing protein [Streptomyces sp. NBC_01187]